MIDWVDQVWIGLEVEQTTYPTSGRTDRYFNGTSRSSFHVTKI